MIKTRNIQVTRGQTKILVFTVKDQRGQRQTLTGCQIYAAVRADMKVDPQVKLTTESVVGWRTGIVIDPDQALNQGKFTITLIPTDTAALIALGADDPYFWDVWMIDELGQKFPLIATSKLDLYPEVTVTP